jgi:uncharacterized membrane protein
MMAPMTAAGATTREDALRASRTWVWPTVVWAGAAIYTVAIAAESIHRHRTYQTIIDVAIHDQRLWLLSHWRDPFSTIATKPFLGDHFEPALVLLTPLYWLGLGVPGMLAAQAVAVALAAPALYALARTTGASRRLAAIPALLWLASPAVAAVNLFEFRPGTFVSVLLVLSVLAAREERWVLLAATTALALGLKEDVALTYAMLGLVVALQGKRRLGAGLAACSAVVFVLAIATIGALSDQLEWQARRFAGDRGESLLDVARYMLRNPLESAADLLANGLPVLGFQLLSTGGLALLAPVWMLLALPTLLFNAASAYGPQHDLAYQYSQLAFTGLFVAAAIGVGRLESAGTWARRAAAIGVVGALALSVGGGVFVHRGPRDVPAQERRAIAAALERIPPDASVSASTDVLPHLSQRAEIYAFPQPFARIDWGGSLTDEELAERAERVEYVVIGELIPIEADPDISAVERRLEREGWKVVAETETLRVLRRAGSS